METAATTLSHVSGVCRTANVGVTEDVGNTISKERSSRVVACSRLLLLLDAGAPVDMAKKTTEDVATPTSVAIAARKPSMT